jgi:hypothetical protein
MSAGCTWRGPAEPRKSARASPQVARQEDATLAGWWLGSSDSVLSLPLVDPGNHCVDVRAADDDACSHLLG